MYLLYLDESGTHGGSPGYLLSGIAVHEHDVYHLQQRLETMLQAKLPAGMAAVDFELHGSEIKTPANYRRRGRPPSPWEQFDYGFRIDVLRSAYSALARYERVDGAYPCVLFGAVVDRYYADRKRRAYEEVLHRFDEMLGRQARAAGEHQRGIVIHDESSLEPNVQEWTQRWREVSGRIPGRLTHIVDVPFFADSRASRMIQAADLVTFALWRFYGLPRSDTTWIDPLWSMFDSVDGKMHGLIHVSPSFRTGDCGCRPCQARAA
jgi:Protein of unknown function (DUF3800)